MKWLTMLSIGWLLAGPAQALEWVQIGHRGGDPVCGNLQTGLEDVRGARFHAWSRLDNSRPDDRVRVQRGSRITLRLLGHGADSALDVDETTRGLNASLGTRGRYTNQPRASGPIGFVDLKIDVGDTAELGPASVRVKYPVGADRVVLQVVRDCTSASVAAAPAPHDETCFGAAGSQCGLPQGPLNPAALCANGMCLVNGGSWRHDECCFAHPGGKFCRGGADNLIADDGHCRVEWDDALFRAGTKLNWHREVRFSEVNRSGRVDAAKYCAPRGAIVHAADERFCCSNQGVPREPTADERRRAATSALVLGYTTPGPAQYPLPVLPPGTLACR